MADSIELIASTANWLTHTTGIRRHTESCASPVRDREMHFEICYGTRCEQCPHWSRRNTTEIVNVLYRSFK